MFTIFFFFQVVRRPHTASQNVTRFRNMPYSQLCALLSGSGFRFLLNILYRCTHHCCMWCLLVYLFTAVFVVMRTRAIDISIYFYYVIILLYLVSRPFSRRLPEFQFWLSSQKGLLMAFGMTFFSLFDIPVFWPILLIYFIVLMVRVVFRCDMVWVSLEMFAACSRMNVSMTELL